MSAESLEDGEIASEAEPTPEPEVSCGFNDEVLIDQIIQEENETARKSNSPVPSNRKRNNRNERRAAVRRQEASFAASSSRNMGTSWHTNGGSGAGGRPPIRPSPSEAVIFGMPAAHQQMPNQDITRLQNLVNQTRGFYSSPLMMPQEPPRQPFHYFPAPSDPIPLMSLPLHGSFLPPPPPPPPLSLLQPISPTPLFHGDNYEEVSMDIMTPEEPQQMQNDPFVKPPIQIPLEAVPPFAPPGIYQPPTRTSTASMEDEESLRAMLLSQLNQKKKRNADKSSQSNVNTAKRSRKNSSKLSDSVKNVFETQKPIQPQPPVPKIQVKLASTPVKSPVRPSVAVTVTSPVVAVVAPVAAPVAPVVSEPSVTPTKPPMSREEKRAQLDQRMSTINNDFEERRKKVENASRLAKQATEMAKEAAEMAKRAEEMSRNATEMRQKCKEDLKSGKEDMKKLLIEKREIQNAIDIMSIDDMEGIDDEDYPEISFTAIKNESNRSILNDGKLKEEAPKSPLPTVQQSLSEPIFGAMEYLSQRQPENSSEAQQEEVDKHEEEEDREETEEAREYQEFEDISDNVSENLNNSAENKTENEDEHEEEEVEGEDEYEEEEEDVSGFVAPILPTTSSETSEALSTNGAPTGPEDVVSSANDIDERGPLDAEQLLRRRLLNKFARTIVSPDNNAPVVSSSIPDRVEECRNVLLQMCKFELNGKCERPRNCSFLHLHNINDEKQQAQLLEGLFREVFQYSESDIEPAIKQTMHFLPEFREFEKLMDQFFKVVIHKTPDYKNRLFAFFANRR